MKEIEDFIIKNVADGKIGVGTMDLYQQGFSVRNINATIREMIDNGKISISCSAAGFRIFKREGWDSKGCEISLRKKDFDIRFVK